MLQLRNFQGIDSGETWVTIGSFDGVHTGHQELIRRIVDGAHKTGALAAVVTFYPHPAVVLGKRPGNINLMTQQERALEIEHLGVDLLVTQTFDAALAATTARDYISKLKNALHMVDLWVGHDFALGKDREGNLEVLRAFGVEMGFAVHPVEAVQSE